MFRDVAPARDRTFRHVGNIVRFGIAQFEALAIDRPLDNALPKRLLPQAIEAVDEDDGDSRRRAATMRRSSSGRTSRAPLTP